MVCDAKIVARQTAYESVPGSGSGNTKSRSVRGTVNFGAGVGEPCHRVAADGAIALRDVRPVDVVPQTEKNSQGALVGAIGQYDFIAFVEYRRRGLIAHHIRLH